MGFSHILSASSQMFSNATYLRRTLVAMLVTEVLIRIQVLTISLKLIVKRIDDDKMNFVLCDDSDCPEEENGSK